MPPVYTPHTPQPTSVISKTRTKLMSMYPIPRFHVLRPRVDIIKCEGTGNRGRDSGVQRGERSKLQLELGEIAELLHPMQFPFSSSSHQSGPLRPTELLLGTHRLGFGIIASQSSLMFQLLQWQILKSPKTLLLHRMAGRGRIKRAITRSIMSAQRIRSPSQMREGRVGY